MATAAHSTRPLSERLSDLSRRAKAAEDSFANARTETKLKLDSRLEQARSSVEQLKQKIQHDVSSATEQTASEWNELQVRFTKRVAKIRADFNARKEHFESERATLRAEWAEDDAAAAVEDAIGAIEYARYAVLYAAAVRQDADTASR
jgi:hypothetical protein